MPRRDAPPVPREAEVLAACIGLLRWLRVPAFRVNSGAAVAVGRTGKRRYVRFNTAEGCSDLIAVAPGSGRIICIEVKAPGGRLWESQKAFLDNIRAAGGLALCVRSPEELLAALRAERIVP